MNAKKTMTRDEMPADFKWNIEAMYPDELDWEQDFLEVIKLSEQYETYSGRLATDSKTLLEAFKDKDKIWQLLKE